MSKVYTRIMLDDERTPSFLNWSKEDGPIVVVRDFNQFKAAIKKHASNIGIISFDHDLGLDSKSGYDCITWLESQIHFGNVPLPPILEVHSMNPIGRIRIQQVINKLRG